MAGGKETPRQKMIGLMYLVLMALLAMNVSKEIINAFVTLNNNIDDANKTMIQSIYQTRNEINEKLMNPEIGEEAKAKLQVWSDKADAVHDMAQNTANFFIAEAQFMMNESVPGEWVIAEENTYHSVKDLVLEEYSKRDDYDTPTRIFVGDDHENINERGTQLKVRMENYRDSLLMMLTDLYDEKTKTQYKFEPFEIVKATPIDFAYLNSDEMNAAMAKVRPQDTAMAKDIIRILTLPKDVQNHDETYPWQAGQFDHAPIVAAAAVFTSLKGRVIQAEKIAMDYFNAQGESPRFKFNKIDALSFARTSYINVGDSLQVRVQIAAYDSTADTRVEYWVDDSVAFLAQDRKSESYRLTTKNTFPVGQELGGSVGNHMVYGNIEVEENDQKKWQPFVPYAYKIGAPSSAIGNAEMNVMYIGYNNLITASGSGFTDVTASCPGCSSWSKSGDNYTARVAVGKRKVTVNLSGKDKDGKTQSIDSKEFRVLPMPRPRVYAINSADKFATKIPKTALAATAFRSELVGSPLQIASMVTGGTVKITVQGVTATYPFNGPRMPAAAGTIIRQLRPGSLVVIEPRATLAGAPIPVASVAYTVQ